MAKPQLSSELILEAPQRVPDGGGGARVVWTPVGKLWAEVRSVSARERVSGRRESTRVTHRITLRAAPENSPRRPTAECRFRQGARIFAIRGVAPSDVRGQFLTCWAEEGPFT